MRKAGKELGGGEGYVQNINLLNEQKIIILLT